MKDLTKKIKQLECFYLIEIYIEEKYKTNFKENWVAMCFQKLVCYFRKYRLSHNTTAKLL